MNNTLKQLQEKGEEYVEENIVFLEYHHSCCWRKESTDKVKDFLHQQTTLAFEAGKAETLAMVLKEIEGMNEEFIMKPIFGEQIMVPFISKKQILDTLKTKLIAKE